MGNSGCRQRRWNGLRQAVLGLAVMMVGAVLWGQRLRRRGNFALASFAFALPVLPVLLSLGVLADSYM